MPSGTKLPVKLLLQQIPEIGTQLDAVGISTRHLPGVLQLIAQDDTHSWPLLAIEGFPEGLTDPVRRTLLRQFEKVAQPAQFRDHFGLSRRWGQPLFFMQGREPAPKANMSDADPRAAMSISWALKDILATREVDPWDARLAPGLYKSKLLLMPPSLARYAIAFYTSSLVRYRPAMFDTQTFPDQAFLFDAITREISLNILVDTFAGLTGRDQHFHARGDLRV